VSTLGSARIQVDGSGTKYDTANVKIVVIADAISGGMVFPLGIQNVFAAQTKTTESAPAKPPTVTLRVGKY
jgi:hypothetical protein